MSRRKQASASLPSALNEKLLELGARIISGAIGEPEALDILEAVAINAPVQVIAMKWGSAA